MMSGLLPPLSSRTSGGVSPYLLLLRVRGLLDALGAIDFGMNFRE